MNPVKGSAPAGNPKPALPFAEPLEPARVWEYSVLVTNAEYDLEAIGQLYRDRADCENGFDELKNQWGWGGYARRATWNVVTCRLAPLR